MGRFSELPDEVGTFVLIGSLLTAPVAWVGGTDLLAATGISQSGAAVLAGVYVLVRSLYAARSLRERLAISDRLTEPLFATPTPSVGKTPVIGYRYEKVGRHATGTCIA